MELKRFIVFFSRVPWKATIVGVTLGMPCGVALAAHKKTPFAWQISAGVLLGGVVGWIIPEFINNLRAQWKTAKPLNRLLDPLQDNTVPTTVTMASLYPTGTKAFGKVVPLEFHKRTTVEPHHGLPWVVAEGDALALGYVMSILAKAGRTSNTTITRDDAQIEMASSNLICIGSSKSNLKTRTINASFHDLPLRFDWANERLIIRSRAGDTWETTDSVDFGILMKVPSDYNESRSIMIIGGISYIATAGAAYYLWSHWQQMAVTHNSRNYSFVIEVRRDDYQHVRAIWP